MKKIFIISSLFFLFSVLSAQNPNPEMIFMQGSTFKMGNNESQCPDESPVHDVILNNYSISKYEITESEFSRFSRMAGLNRSAGEDLLPATNLSWYEAIMYCNWLSQINGLERCYIISRTDGNITVRFIQNAKGYRLPTEAEWEYAAKGGIQSKKYIYSGSNTASEIAWYVETGKQLHKPGLKAPNELEIYDMSGNCLEWCYDNYESKYPKDSQTNTFGPKTGTTKVCRGGNYKGVEEDLRVTKRYYEAPDYKDESLGFRVAKNE